ncbi:peptide-methionine (R)-S-oxide reductase [Propioniferax innocua]|uniref:peptide-methionine (R)-S-oxide reductase n=2 Tax=Propioniferax innocua TaxID=1753 RepID=A0A542ZQN3_9ACTN|nr:peptide-methionine (R)-S-oxide reductase [Propioniferax innocua]
MIVSVTGPEGDQTLHYVSGHTLADMTESPEKPKLSVLKTEDEWREMLTPAEYQVLRQAGTEPPFVGEYTDTTTEGVYRCRACNAELFRSETKFESHCGWPSFFSPLAEDTVRYVEDRSIPGPPRVEVRCTACDSHLGHVFAGEGYQTPTDLRYCINSICLTLEPTQN